MVLCVLSGVELQGDLLLYPLLYPTGEHTSSTPGEATSETKSFLSQSVLSLGVLVAQAALPHCEGIF